jgi:site-specific recombinase XerD
MKTLPSDLWIQEYLEELSLTHRPKTVSGYGNALKHLEQFCVKKGIQVHRLQRELVVDWMKVLTNRETSVSYRHIVLISIRGYLRWLKRKKRFQVDPEEVVRPSDFPRRPVKLPRPLDLDLDLKIQSSLKSTGTAHALGLLLMRKTGMRIGELSWLPFHCFFKDHKGRAFLKVPLGKLQNERTVPISPDLVALIQSIQEQTRKKAQSNDYPYLLISREGSRISERALSQRFHAILRTIPNLPREQINPHRFRHTYATELLNAGMGLASIKQLLGHRSIQMTLHYAAVTQHSLLTEFNTAQLKLQAQYQFPAGLSSSSDTMKEIDPLQALLHAECLIKKKYGSYREKKEKKFLYHLLKRIRALQQLLVADQS